MVIKIDAKSVSLHLSPQDKCWYVHVDDIYDYQGILSVIVDITGVWVFGDKEQKGIRYASMLSDKVRGTYSVPKEEEKDE